MSVQAQGVGTIFRGDECVGHAQYVVDMHIMGFNRPSPNSLVGVRYRWSLDGVITMLDAPALPAGEDVDLELMSGRRFSLIVEDDPADEGAQHVTGVSAGANTAKD
jgi:hypothetical protein